MSTIKANDIQNASGGIPTVKGQRLIPTAWVNFNGTGTVAIRDSENVSSITDGGVGNYTVNFATAMANANYSVVFSSNREASTNAPVCHHINSRLVGSFQAALVKYNNSAFVDSDYIGVTILGGQA